MTIDNWLTLSYIILLGIGGYVALGQWMASSKIKRAEFINEIIERFMFDKEMAKTLYWIEYDDDWYDNSFHNNKDGIECSVDQLLSYLSYICYLYSTGNIKWKEFKFLQYELNRACISRSVQAYLWNLYHFSKSNNTPCSFMYVIEYAIKHRFFRKEFTNKDFNGFPKYLNF